MRSFLLGAGMAALVAQLVVVPAAGASPPESCIAFRHNVEGGELIGYNQDLQVGVLSDMRYEPWNNDCNRVSSEAVNSITGAGTVEWGWVLGWSPNGAPQSPNQYTGPGACDDHYYTDPELFIVWQPTGGGYHCKDVASISTISATTHSMSVFDNNGNTIFDAWYDGSQYATADVDFFDGFILTNGERHNNSDSAYAGFGNLQKRLHSAPTTWTPFTFSYEYCDTDPGYDWQLYTNIHTRVYAHGTTTSC